MNVALSQLVIANRVIPKGTEISDEDMALIRAKYPHFLIYISTNS